MKKLICIIPFCVSIASCSKEILIPDIVPTPDDQCHPNIGGPYVEEICNDSKGTENGT